MICTNLEHWKVGKKKYFGRYIEFPWEMTRGPWDLAPPAAAGLGGAELVDGLQGPSRGPPNPSQQIHASYKNRKKRI